MRNVTFDTKHIQLGNKYIEFTEKFAYKYHIINKMIKIKWKMNGRKSFYMNMIVDESNNFDLKNDKMIENHMKIT